MKQHHQDGADAVDHARLLNGGELLVGDRTGRSGAPARRTRRRDRDRSPPCGWRRSRPSRLQLVEIEIGLTSMKARRSARERLSLTCSRHEKRRVALVETVSTVPAMASSGRAAASSGTAALDPGQRDLPRAGQPAQAGIARITSRSGAAAWNCPVSLRNLRRRQEQQAVLLEERPAAEPPHRFEIDVLPRSCFPARPRRRWANSASEPPPPQ